METGGTSRTAIRMIQSQKNFLNWASDRYFLDCNLKQIQLPKYNYSYYVELIKWIKNSLKNAISTQRVLSHCNS